MAVKAIVKRKPGKTFPTLATLTVRVDRDLLDRFRYVAASEHRSCNAEFTRMIEERVAQFDAERQAA